MRLKANVSTNVSTNVTANMTYLFFFCWSSEELFDGMIVGIEFMRPSIEGQRVV